MQVTLDAARRLHRAGPAPLLVRVRVPDLPYCDRPSPQSSDEARFSFQYQVALGLLDGGASPESYTEARLGAPDMQAMLARIEVRRDPSISTRFDEMRVAAVLDDGAAAESDRWPGHWRSPMTPEDQDAKLAACMGDDLPAGVAARLRAACAALGEPGSLLEVLHALRALPAGMGRAGPDAGAP